MKIYRNDGPDVGGGSGGDAPKWAEEAIEAGWVSPDELSERHNRAVANVTARYRSKLETVEEREDNLRAELEELRVKADSGNPDDGDSDVSAQIKRLEAKLEATVGENAKLTNEIESLRKSRVEADILRLAAPKFEDPDDAVVNLRGRFTADGAVLDENGEEALNEKGEPMTLSDLVDGLGKRKPHLLKESVRKGTGFNEGGGETGDKSLDDRIAEAENEGKWGLAVKLKTERMRLRAKNK